MRGDPPLLGNPERAASELKRISRDSWSGMLYSNLASYFIILATALTLQAAGITQIDTAAQAATALRPLAGNRPAFALEGASFSVMTLLAQRLAGWTKVEGPPGV